jgi:hypothetical protein
MNHDPTPTSPADGLDPNSHRREDDDAAVDDDHGVSSRQHNGSAASRRRRRSKLSKKAKAGMAKKLVFLLHLLMSLDAVIYAELCVLYYME